MTDASDSVKIERTIPADRADVWSMWTERFGEWYGPMGAQIPVAELDVRVGGSRKVCMEMDTPNGPMQMWFVGEHLEIVEGERFVYTESMGDAEGNATSPSTRVVVDLSDTESGTHMVMTHEGVPADSPGAMGWNMAIDKLASHFDD